MARGVAARVGLVCALVSAIGCASAPDNPEAGPFHLTWTDFHFELGGVAVMEVRDDAVRDLFPAIRSDGHGGVAMRDFRLASYRLTPAEGSALRRAAGSEGFWDLDARYLNKEIIDGTTQTFTVNVGGQRKTVLVYQERPAGLEDLHGAILRIQRAHQADRARAAWADFEVAKKMRDDAERAQAAAD